MNLGVLIPIVAIIAWACVTIAVIHYRHLGRTGRSACALVDDRDASENVRLGRENESLRMTVERLEDRLAVLERIATDPAERTAREIEALR